MRRAPILLAYGFRPFFLAAPLAAWGAVLPLPLLWLGLGGLGAGIGAWHAHEQVFGTLTAALAGFLLTALPSWTGTAPVAGRPLAILVALWLAGRVAFWLDFWLPSALVAAIDLAFLPALLAATLPKGRPWEFPAALLALTACNLAFHLGRLDMIAVPPERAAVAALDLFLVLIAVALGRILPVTLRSALVEQGRAPMVRLAPGRRHLTTATLLLFAVADAVAPTSAVTGWIALAAACAVLDRMGESHLSGVLARPQAGLFYLGQALIAAGLAGLGLGLLGAGVEPVSVRHAAALGGAGITALAVQSVVALRHTGRAFPLPRATWIAPALVVAATALRTLVPHLAPEAMAVWGVTVPALLWSLAFLAWLKIFGPWLIAPRIDGEPG